MSEYQNAKRIIKQMRLGRKQSQEVAARAFEADMEQGRPDIALKCAREFKLDDVHLTRAATALFLELVKRAKFPKALEIARSYNLAHGGEEATHALKQVGQLNYAGGGEALDEIRRLASAAAQARQEVSEAERAIALIRKAGEVRGKDSRCSGRAVLLGDTGEVWLTGDLHGNVENLKRFAQLADLSNHPQRILVLQEIVHSRHITADNRDLSFVAIMEAIRLVAEHPGQVYYLLGNHDLAVHLNRELVKGGKYLNRYLFRGMAYMYRERYEDVLEAYQEFIADMPAAILAPNGIFMAHSTPKRAYIPSLSRSYLSEEAAERPLGKSKPINALVNGRDYKPDTADAFADQLGCQVMLCGHTPTRKGWRLPNHRHLILDSQHAKARYIRFDLSKTYASSRELAQEMKVLNPKAEEDEPSIELM